MLIKFKKYKTKMLDYLGQSWFGSVLTIVTFLFAILLAIYLFFKARIVKKLSVYPEYETIIDKAPSLKDEALEIFYQGQKVEQLNKTKIYIWNSGNQTIYKKDIENVDPPRVYIDDSTKILQINISNMTRSVINASVKAEELHNLLIFDFLDPTDGLVLEILHTGEDHQVRFEGTIIGIRKKLSLEKKSYKWPKFCREVILHINNSMFPFFDKTFGLVATILGFVVFLAGLSMLAGMNYFRSANAFQEGLAISLVGLIYFIVGAIIYQLMKEPYPKKLKIKSEL